MPNWLRPLLTSSVVSIVSATAAPLGGSMAAIAGAGRLTATVSRPALPPVDCHWGAARTSGGAAGSGAGTVVGAVVGSGEVVGGAATRVDEVDGATEVDEDEELEDEDEELEEDVVDSSPKANSVVEGMALVAGRPAVVLGRPVVRSPSDEPDRSLPGSTSEAWKVGPDITACPPPMRYGSV